MCTDTPQRYLRRILVSDFKQTKRWPIIPSLRRCQCSPPPAYLSMCTDTPQRYLRRILILISNKKTLAVRSHFKIGSHFCGNPVHCTRSLCYNMRRRASHNNNNTDLDLRDGNSLLSTCCPCSALVRNAL